MSQAINNNVFNDDVLDNEILNLLVSYNFNVNDLGTFCYKEVIKLAVNCLLDCPKLAELNSNGKQQLYDLMLVSKSGFYNCVYGVVYSKILYDKMMEKFGNHDHFVKLAKEGIEINELSGVSSLHTEIKKAIPKNSFSIGVDNYKCMAYMLALYIYNSIERKTKLSNNVLLKSKSN